MQMRLQTTATTTMPLLFNYVFYHINRDWSVGRLVGRWPLIRLSLQSFLRAFRREFRRKFREGLP